MNKPIAGSALRENGAFNLLFRVSQQPIPTSNVKINPGSFISENGVVVEYMGGNSPVILAPTANAAWRLISIDAIGKVVVTAGIPSTNPIPPAVPKNHLPCAMIYQRNIDTVITQDMIFDIRPFLTINHNYILSHADLVNVNAVNSHEIAAITGLQASLDSKITLDVLTTSLQAKADIDGTSSPEFILNKDATGVPVENVSITVKRGASTDVGIKWNEVTETWQFTNDGITWNDISNGGFIGRASDLSEGTSKLSVAPVDELQPIAVGNNDPRVLTISEKSDLLSHMTDNTDPHGVKGSLTAADIPSHDHSEIGQGGILAADSVTDVQIKSDVITEAHLNSLLTATLVRKNSSNEITSVYTFNPTTEGTPFSLGVNAIDQLVSGLNADKLDGLDASELSLATHNHDTVYVAKNSDITAATGIKVSYDVKGLVTGSTSLEATDIPNLDWTKITTGTPTTLSGYGITDGALSTHNHDTVYAPIQTGVSDTFTTVDGKTITVVDGVITSITA